MSKRLLYPILFFSMLVFSCNKDEEGTVPASSQTDILTAKEWKHKKYTLKDVTQTPQNLFIKFNSDGNYFTNDSIYLFNSSADFSGKWEFYNDGRAILFNKSKANEQYIKLTTLNSEEMTFTFDKDDYQTGDYMGTTFFIESLQLRP